MSTGQRSAPSVFFGNAVPATPSLKTPSANGGAILSNSAERERQTDQIDHHRHSPSSVTAPVLFNRTRVPHIFLCGDLAVTRAGTHSLIHAWPSIIETCQEALSYTMILTPPLQEALNDAISSGRFIDTKIVLYSRRDSSGRVCKPRALYANSHVLKTVPYFDDRESHRIPSTMYEVTLPLEYFRAHFLNRRLRTSLRPLTTARSPRAMTTRRTVTLKRIGILRVPFPRTANHNLANKNPSMVNTKNTSGWERSSGSEMPLSSRASTQNPSSCSHRMEFESFQAFLLYLYTDSIEFAPYGSKGNRKSRSPEIAGVRGGEIPKPSPKSIYRLADKVSTPRRP